MEDFVPFEIAKKLKEKGYPQYWSETDVVYVDEDEKGFKRGEMSPIDHIPEYTLIISAPTISQVLKWLREEKKIYIDIRFSRYYQLYKVFSFTMCRDNVDMCEKCFFDNYERASIAGIEYVLDNLI